MKRAFLVFVVAACALAASAQARAIVGDRSRGACGPPQAGVTCGPGNDRQTPGGGDKVPHHNGLNSRKGQRATRVWPKISGIFWMVVDTSRDPRKRRMQRGGPRNDELLGRHGTDVLVGAGGHDVLWGDWDPVANNTRQRDVLSGGSGNDWIYPSHGYTVVRGGPGVDYVWAYYGRGTIDCGPGDDTARIRTTGAFKVRNCEHVKHFCAHGENARGQCLSPTGRPVRATLREGLTGVPSPRRL